MAISIQYNNSVLLNSININVDDNQYYKYVSSELINFKKDNIYQISFKSISNVVEPFILFVTSSGGTDAFNYDSNFGKPIYTPNCALNSYQDHTNRFTADNDGTGYICFAFKYGNYYVSDIKVTPYQGLNYSPDNAIITIPTPDAKRNENMSISIIYKSPDGLRVGDPESYLSNTGYPISETDYNPITGSNILISRDDNLLEGALFIGKSLRSGIELNGGSSAFIRSIGFDGFKSASLGIGGPGFLIWSGSILPSSGDGYTGVGMDMVLNSSNYFRFRTNPSELDIHTDMIFIGNPNINYISASNGKIEISSSNFLLSSSGDVIVSGEINAESGIIAGLYIKSASIQNSPLNAESTVLIGSASYYYNTTNFSDRSSSLQEDSVSSLTHDVGLYVGSNPATDYYKNGFGYKQIMLSSSNAQLDVGTPGYLRMYFDDGVGYTTYDISRGSVLLNTTIRMENYFDIDMQCNGISKFGIKYYDDTSPLNTVYYDLIPTNYVKNLWSAQTYSISEYTPSNANKFICWIDFYVKDGDYTYDYKVYDIHIDYQKEFLEISPDGFFYRVNDDHYIKLGRGHYEIKGGLIESDKFQSRRYVFIGSGSYDSGSLDIKQYTPLADSGILMSFNDHKTYQWIGSNGSYNFMPIVQTEAPISNYYNFYGDGFEGLVYNIYKDVYSNHVFNLGATQLQFSSSNYIYTDIDEQFIFNSYSPNGKYFRFLYNTDKIIDIYSSSNSGYNKNIIEITGSVKVTGSMYLNDKQGGQSNSGEVLTFSKNVTAAVGMTATSSLQNDLLSSGSISLISGSCRLYKNKEYTGLMYRYELPELTTFYTSSAYASPDANSYIKDMNVNYVVAEYNNGNPRYRVTQNVEEINESDIFPVYSLFRSGSAFNWIDWDSLGRGLPNRLHQRLVKTQRFARENGLDLYTDVSVIGITGGRAWIGAVRHTYPAMESDIDNTRIYYQDSSNTWASEAISGFDNVRWNDLSTYTLENLSPNSYNVNWIYRNMVDIDSPYSTDMAIILGSANKLTIEEARLIQPPTTLPVEISAMGILVGKILVREGVATAIEVYSAWNVGGMGGGISGGDGSITISSHNSLTGLQGGAINDYYHSTYAEYTGTGTGIFVREKDATLSGDVIIDGTLTADSIIAGTITETSDERLKFNIRPLENQLDNFKLLSPKRFNFIKNPDEEEIGLIAQEVQKIYPEFVNEINGVYSIEYSKLTVVLIQALKEMQDENTALQNRLGDLENKVDVLLNFLNK